MILAFSYEQDEFFPMRMKLEDDIVFGSDAAVNALINSK